MNRHLLNGVKKLNKKVLRVGLKLVKLVLENSYCFTLKQICTIARKSKSKSLTKFLSTSPYGRGVVMHNSKAPKQLPLNLETTVNWFFPNLKKKKKDFYDFFIGSHIGFILRSIHFIYCPRV